MDPGHASGKVVGSESKRAHHDGVGTCPTQPWYRALANAAVRCQHNSASGCPGNEERTRFPQAGFGSLVERLPLVASRQPGAKAVMVDKVLRLAANADCRVTGSKGIAKSEGEGQLQLRWERKQIPQFLLHVLTAKDAHDLHADAE